MQLCKVMNNYIRTLSDQDITIKHDIFDVMTLRIQKNNKPYRSIQI